MKFLKKKQVTNGIIGLSTPNAKIVSGKELLELITGDGAKNIVDGIKYNESIMQHVIDDEVSYRINIFPNGKVLFDFGNMILTGKVLDAEIINAAAIRKEPNIWLYGFMDKEENIFILHHDIISNDVIGINITKDKKIPDIWISGTENGKTSGFIIPDFKSFPEKWIWEIYERTAKTK